MIAVTEKMRSELRLLSWFVTESRARQSRSIYDFACQEFVIPEGRYKGRRYDPNRQPFSGMLLHEMGNERWNRFATTGCVQSGKTLTALVVPLMYHLFEIQEDVIIGVPQMEMANEKWKKEFLPSVLKVPKYAALLPDRGQGSRGGKFESLQFKHGPEVRFMSGHGGDEKRSSYTARVLLATEIDKYDTASDSSREADPISQMEARTESYGDDARIYLECTVSIPDGRIWQEYVNGSESRIVCQCPGCLQWVTPEREQFMSHMDATSELQARKMAKFECPECKRDISDDRETMNRNARLLHKGQEIDSKGNTVGEPPETKTLGFRWDAFNNLFWSVPYLGAKEWKSWSGKDDDVGGKESTQFRWTKPFSEIEESVELKPFHVQRTANVKYARGVKPDDTRWSVACIDVNKPVLHWTATAFRQNGTAHIFDYGKTGTNAAKLGFDRGIRETMSRLQERFGSGWSDDGLDMVCIDCRWNGDDIIESLKELRDKRWMPFFGMGSGHIKDMRYVPPAKINRTILWIGPNCYVKLHEDHYIPCLHADANAYKTSLAERFLFEPDNETGEVKPGGISIFGSMDEQEHFQFAKHLTAEKQVQRFVRGKGWQVAWDAIRSSNHWLDSTYMTLPAGSRLGFSFKPLLPKASKATSGRQQSVTGEQTSPFANSFQR